MQTISRPPALSREAMLEAFFARDRDLDGRFVVGVVTTGIYCLPSCPARRPKPENVRFFGRPAAARDAGLRACRRCRPDAVLAGRDPDVERMETLLGELRRDPGAFRDTAALARAAGVGTSRLAELARLHLHASPGEVLRRERVGAAARRLLEDDGPVFDAGLAAGWESSSAFHAAFQRHRGLSPAAYRRLATGEPFELALPEDVRRVDTVRHLGRDPASPTEAVSGCAAEGFTVVRALRVAGGPALLVIELPGEALEPPRARCRLETVEPLAGLAEAERTAAMVHAHAVARRLLGLDVDPAGLERRAAEDPLHARLVAGREGTRIPQTATVFEGVLWSIVGQQVNLGFAFRLRRRLVELAGEPVPGALTRRVGVGGLVCHPTPERIASLDPDDLLELQLSRRKGEYLVGVAGLAAAGDLDLEALPGGVVTTARRRLLAVRGLGPWSTDYVLLRACAFADCVPLGDAGLKAALERFHGLEGRPDRATTEALMAPFAPWRSLATTHLWKSLGSEDGDDDP